MLVGVRQEVSGGSLLSKDFRTMKRREALRTIISASSFVFLASGYEARAEEGIVATPTSVVAGLPPLPYGYDALSPVIDAETMQLHHGAHHRAYVEKVTAALAQWSADSAEAKSPLPTILAHLDRVPESLRQTIRNNGGGHLNHSLFWETMTPQGGGDPKGPFAEALVSTFGSVAQFKEKFESVGLSHFGSGWVWLSLDGNGRLDLASYPNQDCPAMVGKTPLIGNDLWEHAYYLTYRNRRAEYLKAWWKIVAWNVVERRFEEARKSSK